MKHTVSTLISVIAGSTAALIYATSPDSTPDCDFEVRASNFNAEQSCWEEATPVGCIASRVAICGEMTTKAIGPDGDCYLFPKTCLPEGFEEAPFGMTCTIDSYPPCDNERSNIPLEGSRVIQQLLVSVGNTDSREYQTAYEQSLTALPEDRTPVVRSRPTHINHDLLIRSAVPSELLIELFDDITCHARNKSVRDYKSGVWTWIGTCDITGTNYVRISKMPDGFVRGRIRLPHTSFHIRPVTEALYVVYEFDVSRIDYEIDL